MLDNLHKFVDRTSAAATNLRDGDKLSLLHPLPAVGSYALGGLLSAMDIWSPDSHKVFGKPRDDEPKKLAWYNYNSKWAPQDNVISAEIPPSANEPVYKFGQDLRKSVSVKPRPVVGLSHTPDKFITDPLITMPPKRPNNKKKRPMPPRRKIPRKPKLVGVPRRPKFGIITQQPKRGGKGRPKRFPLIQKTFTAPIQYGAQLNSGLEMNFAPGPAPGDLVLYGKYRIGQLSSTSAAATSNNCVFTPPDGTGAIPANIVIMPGNLRYTQANVTLITNLFERWEAEMSIEFKSGCASNTSGRIFMCHLPDLDTVESSFNADLTVPITLSQVSGMPKLIETNVWKDLKTPWVRPDRKDDMKYTGNSYTYDGTPNLGTISDAELRQTTQGVFIIGYNGVSPSQVHGDLFAYYKIHLSSMVASNAYIIPLLKARMLNTARKKNDLASRLTALELESKRHSAPVEKPKSHSRKSTRPDSPEPAEESTSWDSKTRSSSRTSDRT